MTSGKINLVAPLNRVGFGIYSVEFYFFLQTIYTDISWTVIGTFDEKELDLFQEELGERADRQFLKEHIVKSLTTDPYTDADSIVIWHPNQMGNDEFHVSSGARYGITHFETDKLSTEEIKSMSKFDIVLTCSAWGNEVLEAHNVPTSSTIHAPIVTYGDYFSEDYLRVPATRIADYSSAFLGENTCNIFSGGKWESRKDQRLQVIALEQNYNRPIMLHSMWHNVFTGGLKEPLEFLLNRGWKLEKTAVADELSVHIFKHPAFGNAITLYPYLLNVGHVSGIHNACDFILSTSKGEGLDQPLVEGIYNNLIPIATWNTAHMQYLGNGCISLICEPEIAKDNRWFHGDKGNWYPTELFEVRHALKEAVELTLNERYTMLSRAQTTLMDNIENSRSNLRTFFIDTKSLKIIQEI